MMADKVHILGAGLAGLAVAENLAREGASPLVFEAEDSVGGLARTQRYSEFSLDRLTHCFFTYNQSVAQMFERLVGDSMVKVRRKGRIHYQGISAELTPQLSNVLGFVGAGKTAAIIGSYVLAHLTSILGRQREDNFEKWAVARFGRQFTMDYLDPYVRKVWGLHACDMSPEWGAKRITAVSLGMAISEGLRRQRHLHLKYCFYLRGGIGLLAERLAASVHKEGGEICTGKKVVKLVHERGKIRSMVFADGQSEQVEKVVSSLPPGSMARMMDPQPPDKVLASASRLRYRGVISVQVLINRPSVLNATMAYVLDPDIPFARVQEPKIWDEEMAPSTKTSLNLEVYCDPGDSTWNRQDDSLVQQSVKSLVKLGWLKSEEVLDAHVVRTADASPVYFKGYRSDRKRVMDYLNQFPNLYPVGRTATYTFKNMDEVFEEAGQVAPMVLRGGHYRFS